MPRASTIQTCSSLLVLATFALSEAAAMLLDANPGSALAWSLNLTVFAPFEQARTVPSMLGPLNGPTTLAYVTLLALLALAAWAVRFRLGVALIAHGALYASVGLARAWLTVRSGGAMSLSALHGRDICGTCLVALLLVVSGIACAAGHAAFLSTIHSERRVPRFPGSWPFAATTNRETQAPCLT